MHRAKPKPVSFRTSTGSIVSQVRLGERFGRTASWVSRQGAVVAGHVFSPSGRNWVGEVWQKINTDGVSYRRVT